MITKLGGHFSLIVERIVLVCNSGGETEAGNKCCKSSIIAAHIHDIYGVEVSDTTVSRITDKILPVAKEWQQRPLESVYAVVFLDAIHFHVRSEGQIVKKAVYITIGIDLDGKKDVLGMWVGENESAKYWASCTQQPSKSRRRGHFYCLYRQPHRFFQCH